MLPDHPKRWNQIRLAHILLTRTDITHLPSNIHTELLLGILSSRDAAFAKDSFSLILQSNDNTATGSTDVFLSSKLRFGVDAYGQEVCFVESNEEQVGVMMGWEREISKCLSKFPLRAV